MYIVVSYSYSFRSLSETFCERKTWESRSGKAGSGKQHFEVCRAASSISRPYGREASNLMSSSRGWSFASIDGDLLGRLDSLRALVPDSYKVDNQGGRRKSVHLDLHTTFLLKLSPTTPTGDRSTVEALRATLEAQPPIELVVTKVFVNKVERIEKPTFCIGVAFESSEYYDLKVKCHQVAGGVVGYGGSHHCSVAYVRERHAAEVQRVIEENSTPLIGQRFTVAAIQVQIGDEVTTLPLGGGVHVGEAT
jgi:hypothetical protein